MEKGKIYKVIKDGSTIIKYYDHNFVFLEDKSIGVFYGIMITHNKRKENIPLESKHFNPIDSNSEKYEIQFDNSYFVPALLIKDSTLPIDGPKGELTQEGIDFISSNINFKNPITWDEAKAYIESLVAK